MRIDTIPKIENYMTDVLLSSKNIPLGVNVIRLAAVQDEEGITSMARSIVVRYTGSSVSIEQKMPIVITRTMVFEVIISAQSYLTESGHDYALQMCAGSYLSLNNTTPMASGIQVLTPLHLVKESFDGLTDSSHYVYTQTWELEVQEINAIISPDPCVMRGTCAHQFPSDVISTVKPGDVLYENSLYTPVLPPPLDEPYEHDKCGVVEEGPDLYYKHAPDILFLANWRNYRLSSTGQFDTSGQFLICNVLDNADGSFVDEFYASNCDGRKVIQIGGPQASINSNWLGASYRSPVDNLGNPPESSVASFFTPVYAQKNGFGYVLTIRATLYVDPTNADAATAITKFGVVYPVLLGANLNWEGTDYVYVGGTSLGKAWIRAIDFQILDQSHYLPETICEELPLEGALDECD